MFKKKAPPAPLMSAGRLSRMARELKACVESRPKPQLPPSDEYYGQPPAPPDPAIEILQLLRKAQGLASLGDLFSADTRYRSARRLALERKLVTEGELGKIEGNKVGDGS